ncbi:glycosyl hydrolase [Pyxidicoccus fallax]|uniref:chitinase n=1 Tax=Pyxidicoccus fallax TaxID=394095 RepID=A0A848LKY6_9BACT|nr:glycosyl hydrolase family 18 protein [Pyxidicoccus fallax]NMO18445.1 glycosyl hydrolase [Pyxidicoccus fallax]NPC78882.1 glycosyl hydrolase [Pyxidicoccus fallax]
MRRSSWAWGLIATALSITGCNPDVTAPEGAESSHQQASLAAAWAPGVFYPVGARVSYSGRDYECRQAHTSQADWTPTAVPALWLDLGPSSGGEPDAGSGNPDAGSGGDVIAPTANITASATRFTAAGTLTLTATASDNVGVSKVEILENGAVVATGGQYSRAFSSRAQNGTYIYSVRAYDAAGNVGTKSVTVTVEFPGDPPPPGGKKIVGYFTAWGIYGRGYNVSNVPAAKLTHINYAFSNISSDGRCVLGDPFADIDKSGGWPGEWNPGQLRGNFRAFKELKRTNPHLKLLISVGGWSWSGLFSQVAATPASRAAFVKSCVDLYIRGQFPGVDPVNGAGVFDGIDIDWEYPVGGGLPGNGNSPADKQNYTLLMQEFRSQLNALSAQTGQQYLLTIASGASPDLLANKQETKNLSNVLDWINVMTYDYHGAFESQVNFHSPLLRVTGDPGASAGFYSDASVAKMLELGVPASKIVLGVPFYGRGWGSVPNVNNGLFQSGVPIMGTWDDGSSGPTGVFDYKDIKNRFERAGSGYTKFFHPEAKEAYVYNPSTRIWIGYDDPQSMSAKSDYILSKGLGGAMFWELSGDDGSLLDALYLKLR